MDELNALIAGGENQQSFWWKADWFAAMPHLAVNTVRGLADYLRLQGGTGRMTRIVDAKDNKQYYVIVDAKFKEGYSTVIDHVISATETNH